jgi:predicted O-methyltransferase YrrM
MTEQELLYASPEDIAFFNECTKGLPDSQVYSCGAHSVRCLREIVGIVKPTSILEIGLNCGYSSAMWLALCPDASVMSVDIKTDTVAAGEFLYNKYGLGRFSFIIYDSAKLIDAWGGLLKRQDFDLIFIDGGHLKKDVIADIKLSLTLGIEWLAFDDIMPRYGEVQQAIDEFPQLELVKTMGNIALYKNANTANNDLL